jgi:hypothetical protein
MWPVFANVFFARKTFDKDDNVHLQSKFATFTEQRTDFW